MDSTLQFVLTLLAAAVVVVVICRSIKLPPLLGYLIVGVAVGPNALGWVPDSDAVGHLAEFGIVFLMFTIGLEFSLPRLIAMRGLVLGLGGAQVGVTALVGTAVAIGIGLFAAGTIGWQAAVVLGCALAMSSTAILAKTLAERLELNSEHGRRIIGVLLFQDLAVVPMLVLVPALSAPAGDLPAALALATAKIAVTLVVLLKVGQPLMRRWFHLVARQKSAELFVLNVLLITLGLSYLTASMGLSLALGAFVAGVLISETEYRFQVEEDIKPFRDILLGLFFITVGMLVDLAWIIQNLPLVLGVLLAMLAVKALVLVGVMAAWRTDSGVSLRVALALSPAGEFGFVLLTLALGQGTLSPAVMQPVLAAMVLSMIAAPFIIEHSEHLVRRWRGSDWMSRAMQLTQIASETMAADRHVIICGYGRSGQNLARLLESEQVPFFALDLDPVRVREAAAAGEHVVFGDAARREVLQAAGLSRARALVISYSDVHSALRILEVVHEIRPELPVIVRTVDDTDIERLKAAGAAEVVAEIMEGSLMLASHALMVLGVPLNRVLRRIRSAREERYGMFRGFFHGASDQPGEGTDDVFLHSVALVRGSRAIGRRLGDIGLEELLADVSAIRRRGVRELSPAPETELREGDIVVLRGDAAAVAAAEMRLVQGV
ncbi:MAG: monovalent cation:proton antiporter-2 (CPA2) family protein [bacterium]|jgi:CPA2 family monovalent cation:H+ antiporter-2|nr:monovalent cation:proton antiporter-2 (CPA2) family protein [Betaproteobacteria bacterium]